MIKEKDVVKKWFVCNQKAIITITKTTNLVNKAIKIHNLTPTTTAVLGRSLTMSVLMGTKLSTKKANITSIIAGNGPVGKVVCVAKENCEVKGYVENPNVDLYLNSQGKLDVSGAVGNNGKLRVIMDLGFGQPYSGEVDLVSGEIAEDFTEYYFTSLQQPSAIALGVLVSPKGKCESSAGFLIEVLPDADDETISTLESMIANVKDFSRLMKESTVDEFISEYFDNAEKMEYEIEPKYVCKCSKSRLRKILKGMNRSDVEELFDEDGKIESKCDFCNKKHIITRDDFN